MTSAKQQEIDGLAVAAGARFRVARLASTAFRDALSQQLPADTLNSLLETTIKEHQRAMDACNNLKDALSSQTIPSLLQAVRLMTSAVEASALAVEQLRQARSLAAADASFAADDECVRCIADARAVIQTVADAENQSGSFLSRLLGDFSAMSASRAAAGIIMILALLGLTVIFYLIYEEDHFLSKLSQIDYARGLITFLLSVGTIIIAFLLVVSALANDGGEADQKKFAMAKEVLTVLLGIFGTILGFYFGSEKSHAASGPSLQLSPLLIAPSSNGLTSLAVNVTGGRPPYHYSIEFSDATVAPIRSKYSKSGHIVQIVTNDTVKSVNFTFSVADTETNEISYKSSDDEQVPPMLNKANTNSAAR